MVTYPISQPWDSQRHYHATYTKDPDSVMPYTINWDTIIPAGDTIDTATSTAYVHGSTTTTTTDITVDGTATTTRTTVTTLSGGVDNTDYDITVHVTTDGGLEDDRTLHIKTRHL
jgi:hypothetical protein